MLEAMRYGMGQMEGKEILAFWTDVSPAVGKKFGHFIDWHELFRTFKISMRGFIPEGEIHEKYRRQDTNNRRVMRVMPRSQYCPQTFFDIGDTFVRFFDPSNMQAIVIENPSVADVLRQLFELAWKAGYGQIRSKNI